MNQSSSARRTRKGYLILAALLAIGLLVFNSDRIADVFRGHVEVVALLENTRGVRVGSPVQVEGVEVGRVTGIGFVAMGDRGALALDLRLEDRARPLVRRGSEAYTVRERFVGEPLVRLTAAPADAPPIQAGDTLFPADIPTAEALLARGQALPAALDSLRSSFRRVQGLAQARQPALTDFTTRLNTAAAEADRLMEQVERADLARWVEDPAVIRRLRRLGQHADSLASAARGLGRFGPGSELAAEASAVMDRADRLAVSLDSLEQRLTGGDGFLPRSSQDTALAVAMERVRAQIDSLRAEGLGFALRTLVP